MSSATSYLILEYYIFYLIGVGILLYFIIKILKLAKKKIPIFNNKYAHPQAKVWMIKYQKIYNIAGIILYSIWTFIIIFNSFSAIPDILNVIKNNYKETTCIVKEKTSNEKKSKRKNMYCTDDKKKIFFTYIGETIEKDTKIKIRYYEYIEIGEIIEYNSK